MGEHGVGGALDVVGRAEAHIVPCAGRVVLCWFLGSGAGAAVGQSDVGVGGCDHPERPTSGARFVIGNCASVQPEVQEPISPSTLRSETYAWALAAHFAGAGIRRPQMCCRRHWYHGVSTGAKVVLLSDELDGLSGLRRTRPPEPWSGRSAAIRYRGRVPLGVDRRADRRSAAAAPGSRRRPN